MIVLDEGLSKELAMLAMPTAPSIHLLTEPGLDGNLFNALRAELQAVAGQLKARGALVTLGEPVGPATTDTGKLVSAERFSSGGPRPSAVQQNVAAWLVFGMFFVIAALSNLFIEERRCGALARLRSLGVPPAVLLLSKALPYFGVNLLQAAMMLAVGVWLMPVLGAGALSFARVDLPALLLVVCAISAAAVSLALMLSCLVRTATQAAAVGPVLNVLMAALGGIMVPTFVMPAVMQTIASLSPMKLGPRGPADRAAARRRRTAGRAAAAAPGRFCGADAAVCLDAVQEEPAMTVDPKAIERSALVADLKALVLEAAEKESPPGGLADDEIMFGPDSRLSLDSLDALQISMAIQQRYGVRMPDSKETRRALASVARLAEHLQMRKA